jgi:hypothetical protein
MYTFIYYRDMEKADRFYGGLLELEMERARGHAP